MYHQSLIGQILIVRPVVLEDVSTNEIDVSGLATGMYFIQLTSEGQTTTKKFIKE